MRTKLILLFLAAALAWGGVVPVKAAAPRMVQKKYYMKDGKKLKIRLKGSTAKRKIKWKSSNKRVATVNKYGIVKGRKAGQVKITASFRYKKKKRKISCTVKVYSMNRKTTTISKGSSLKCDVKATSREVWTSSNPLVATVSKKGYVKGIQPGTAIITGTIHGLSFTRKVRVAGFTESAITISEASPATTLKLKNVTGAITYSSSNENVARVVNNTVIPVSAGSCKITAAAGGKKYLCTVYVTQTKASIFVNYLESYHQYIKKNYLYFVRDYDSSIKTFEDVKARILEKQVVGITCVVPTRWALAAMQIRRADNKSLISGDEGSFIKHYTGDVVTNLRLITSGKPVGMTLKEAVDTGLLRKGDIFAYKDRTHTFVYSGKGYYVYEGGSSCTRGGHYPDGIKMDYSTNFYGRNNFKISQILRWRE